MGKILGSWSGMRKYLEKEMIADCLCGRIRYGCTTYVGMDGCRVFELIIDDMQIKRFSWETVNTYFTNNGYKNSKDYNGIGEYWNQFIYLLDKIPLYERTEYTDEEFCDALQIYRNQNIQKSIESDNPLVIMFALFDRRIGKRTLIKKASLIKQQPEWLKNIYCVRCEAERINIAETELNLDE